MQARLKLSSDKLRGLAKHVQGVAFLEVRAQRKRRRLALVLHMHYAGSIEPRVAAIANGGGFVLAPRNSASRGRARCGRVCSLLARLTVAGSHFRESARRAGADRCTCHPERERIAAEGDLIALLGRWPASVGRAAKKL